MNEKLHVNLISSRKPVDAACASNIQKRPHALHNLTRAINQKENHIVCLYLNICIFVLKNEIAVLSETLMLRNRLQFCHESAVKISLYSCFK